MQEHEAELIKRLEALWRRKWLILVPTFFLCVVAGAVSFLLPPIWEVDAIILPGKFLMETELGQFGEVLVADPKEIAGEINQKSYDSVMAAELKIDIMKFPRLKAENLRDTKLIKVSLRTKDVEKGKAILSALFRYLKETVDRKIDVEINNIDTAISRKGIEIELLNKQILILEKKSTALEKREKSLIAEMSEAKQRIQNIEKEQLNTLKKQEKSESETLSLLLYSNEIQKSMEYADSLNELLSLKSIERADLEQKIKESQHSIEIKKNEVLNLKERKGRIDYSHMVKEPTSSLYPVSPKKKLNVLVTAILSFILFTMIVLLLEFINPKRTTKT